MRSMPSRFALAALSLLCVVVLVACNCAPTLRYITIAPKTASIDAGTTQQFAVTAYYSDGTQKDVTSLAGWSTSAPAIATVTGGVAMGVAPGIATITANYFTLTDSATLTVIRTLKSIAITPVSVTVPAGDTQQYTAMGTYQNGDGTLSTVDITTLVTWNSTTEVATISNTGLATAASSGTGSTTITASLDGITSNNATLTLGPAVVTGLVVTPATKTIAIGNTLALIAMETLSNSTTQIPTAAVVWAPVCTPVGAATFVGNGSTNNYIQVATGQALGTCTVTASEGTLTASTTVSVVAAVAQFAYLSGNADNTISQYSVNAASTTPLTALNPPTVAAGSPQQAFLHPNGLYAYSIAQDPTSTVHLYDIAPGTGTLTLRTGDPQVNSGTGGLNIGVIDPTGRFLYVSDETAGTVNGFTISQVDGTLTPAGGVTGLNTPTDVLVDHQGHYLYVIEGPTVGAGAILAYSINQTSGALTPLSTPSYAVGNQPIFATIDSSDPANPHIYVPNGGDSTISGYTIAPATGLLTQIGSSAFPIPGATANTFVDNAIADPTGKFLFVIDAGGTSPGQVYAFNITAGGVIGSQVGSLVPTGNGPGGMAIDPTGKLLAIDNNVDNTISLYSIASGVLTSETPKPTGSAPFDIVFSIGPGL